MLRSSKRTLSLVLVIQTCASYCTFTSAFVYSSNTQIHNGPFVTNARSLVQQSMTENSHEELDSSDNIRNDQSMERRNVLMTLGALATSAGINASGGIAEASTTTGYIPDGVGGYKKPKNVGGLTKKIRTYGDIMDELQRDLMQERWDLVEKYPEQLRSYVPVFTTYTDSAFPSDAPTDGGLRVALRYEVGRMFAGVERLKQATSRKALDEAYLAYSDMALHFDRYLHVGGLYTYYDATIDNSKFFQNSPLETLVYSSPKDDPALVRDLIVLIKGPDMGKTGIVIGQYPDDRNDNCVVKLDRYMGLREIRVVPRDWAAKRLGEQEPDDVFLIARK